MSLDWFDRLTTAVGVIMLAVMLVVGMLQVLSRYISFPIDLFWTYEVARTLLTLMTIIALPYLFKNNSDISFLPVLERITSRTDEMLLVRNVLMGFLALVLVVSAYQAAVVTGDVGLPMIGWFKLAWGYSLLGASAALLFVMVLIDTKQRIGDIRGSVDRGDVDV